MKIIVAGTGYTGLVTGACLSEVGHNVTCVDSDEKKIERMKQGIFPICYGPKLEELLWKNSNKGNLDFTIDYKNAYKDADLVFIAVDTPEREDGSVNLDYVFNVCKQISGSIEKDCLVVVKSKVPIGTNDKIEEFLNVNVKNKIQVEVASIPEILAQGTTVDGILHAKSIVIGIESKKAENILREIYKPYNQSIVVTNRRSADRINLLAEMTS
jgi:UDPglucose 6-dehydrogenase